MAAWGDCPTFALANQAPIHLTHVCHSWRALAHALPELWTELLLGAVHETKNAHHSLISDWLDRAQGLPLRIMVSTCEDRLHCAGRLMEGSIYDPWFADKAERAQRVIAILAHHAYHLRQLHLTLYGSFYSQYVFGALSDNLPVLETPVVWSSSNCA
jgi:hypothetical protein